MNCVSIIGTSSCSEISNNIEKKEMKKTMLPVAIVESWEKTGEKEEPEEIIRL